MASVGIYVDICFARIYRDINIYHASKKKRNGRIEGHWGLGLFIINLSRQEPRMRRMSPEDNANRIGDK